jgi:hypothetical protein
LLQGVPQIPEGREHDRYAIDDCIIGGGLQLTQYHTQYPGALYVMHTGHGGDVVNSTAPADHVTTAETVNIAESIMAPLLSIPITRSRKRNYRHRRRSILPC